jgi:predicted RNA binding protein YcfA (HicA-like mRNA interferase family)
VKMRDLVKLMTRDGWQLISLRGPHCQFVHPVKPGRITLSADLGHDLGQGTVRSLARQAQIVVKEGKPHGTLPGRR